ncbi:hypothetical protein T484DRAFT_1915978, partial [Baffinella frigidus]
MRPVLYSTTEAAAGKGWYRAGDDISDSCTLKQVRYARFLAFPHVDETCYIAMFTVAFPHLNDTCYIAICYPHTFTVAFPHVEDTCYIAMCYPYTCYPFTVAFPHVDDTCYIAMCYPYTYGDLQRFLAGVSTQAVRAARVQRL